jgi:hypothetical protein
MPNIASGNKLPKLPAAFSALSRRPLSPKRGPFGSALLIRRVQEFFEIRKFLTRTDNKFKAEVHTNSSVRDNPTVMLRPGLGPVLQSDFSAMMAHFNRTFPTIISVLNPFIKSRLAAGETRVGIIAKTSIVAEMGPCLIVQSGGWFHIGHPTAGCELSIFPEGPLEAFLRLVRFSYTNFFDQNHPCRPEIFDSWAPHVLDEASDLLGANPWAAVLSDNEKGTSVGAFLWARNPQEQLQKSEASKTSFPGGLSVSSGTYRRLNNLWFATGEAESCPINLYLLQPELVELYL